MPKRIDLSGERFSYLTVLSFSYIDKHGKSTWLCKCVCGNKIHLSSNRLRSGDNKSCGCKRTKPTTKHGLSKGFRPYRIWYAMKQRCYNKRIAQFKDWGGRGINVCDEWRNDFPTFWNDMKNGYRDDLSIDRINVDGNYCKENCRWANRKQQAQNKRKKTA